MSLEDKYENAVDEVYNALLELKKRGLCKENLFFALDHMVAKEKEDFNLRKTNKAALLKFDAVITRVKQRLVNDYAEEE